MCKVEDALDSTGFGFCKVNAVGGKKGYCNVGVFGGDCCCPVAEPCQTLWDPMDCSTPGSLSFPISWSLLRFMSTESMMLFNHLVLCFTLLLFALNLSQHQGLFQWIGSLHQVAKVLELQLQHQSLQRISGLISFRIHWFDILAVQGTLKNFWWRGWKQKYQAIKNLLVTCPEYLRFKTQGPLVRNDKIPQTITEV